MNKNNIKQNSHSLEYEQQCRICLETVSCKALISPCRCIGSISYVHETCLKTWITSKKEELNEAKCELCNTAFHMKWEIKYACIYHTLVRNNPSQSLLLPILLIFELLICYLTVNVIQRCLDENETVSRSVLIVLAVISIIGFIFLLSILVISVKNLYIAKIVKNCRISYFSSTVEYSVDNKEGSCSIDLVTHRYAYFRSSSLAKG